MSSFQYAGQDEVAFNPATEDLNMNLNLITNAAGIQVFAVAADEVNIGANLRFNDLSYAVTFTGLGLNEDQAYNLPAVGGTSGQVLGLTGNAGQMIWYTVSGGALAGVTSLNGFTDAVTLASNNLDITNDVSNNTIMIDSLGGVASMNTCTGVVEIVSMTMNITPDISNGQIALDVVFPTAVSSLNGLSGELNLLSNNLIITSDSSTNAITIDFSGAVSAGVASLDGLSGEVLLTTDASIIKEVSGQSIDFRVAVPVPAGAVDGDYPTWDTVRGNYGVGTAPVASLNMLNGILEISGGEAINVETSGAYIIISTALPSGLAVPGVSDETALFFTISGVSANVSGNSVVHATVQYPDNIATPQDAWLVYATPSSADGGSITFFLSSAISSGSTLKIAWMVDKF